MFISVRGDHLLTNCCSILIGCNTNIHYGVVPVQPIRKIPDRIVLFFYFPETKFCFFCCSISMLGDFQTPSSRGRRRLRKQKRRFYFWIGLTDMCVCICPARRSRVPTCLSSWTIPLSARVRNTRCSTPSYDVKRPSLFSFTNTFWRLHSPIDTYIFFQLQIELISKCLKSKSGNTANHLRPNDSDDEPESHWCDVCLMIILLSMKCARLLNVNCSTKATTVETLWRQLLLRWWWGDSYL